MPLASGKNSYKTFKTTAIRSGGIQKVSGRWVGLEAMQCGWSVGGRNSAHSGFCFRFCLPWSVSGEVTCTGRMAQRGDCAPFTLNLKSRGWACVRIPRFSGTLPQCEDKFDFSSLRFQSFLDQAETNDQLHKPGRQKGGPWEWLRQRGDCPRSVRAELVGTVPRWQGPWGDCIPEGRVTEKTRPPAPPVLLPPAPAETAGVCAASPPGPMSCFLGCCQLPPAS